MKDLSQRLVDTHQNYTDFIAKDGKVIRHMGSKPTFDRSIQRFTSWAKQAGWTKHRMYWVESQVRAYTLIGHDEYQGFMAQVINRVVIANQTHPLFDIVQDRSLALFCGNFQVTLAGHSYMEFIDENLSPDGVALAIRLRMQKIRRTDVWLQHMPPVTRRNNSDTHEMELR